MFHSLCTDHFARRCSKFKENSLHVHVHVVMMEVELFAKQAENFLLFVDLKSRHVCIIWCTRDVMFLHSIGTRDDG